MSLTLLQGPVSAFREHADAGTGTVHQGNVQVQFKRTAQFRIGNRAVTMAVAPDLVNGDAVTAAGKETGGAFRVIAVRNETTGMIYYEPYFPNWINGLLVLAPILLLPMFMIDAFAGFLFAICAGPLISIGGVINFLKAIPIKGAIAMVRAAPRAAAS